MSASSMPSVNAGEVYKLLELLTVVHTDLQPLCARQGSEVTLSSDKIREACACLESALKFCRTIAEEVDAASRHPDGLTH